MEPGGLDALPAIRLPRYPQKTGRWHRRGNQTFGGPSANPLAYGEAPLQTYMRARC
jgi:hypothetical protein